MNPIDAAELARQLMDAHGLNDWRFRFNNRKQALGICCHSDRRIELSRYFVKDNDAAAVRDTLLHEIAHAIAGHDAGHGPRWRAVCRRIGARPERVDRKANMPAGQWVAVCRQCGHAYDRHRRPMKRAVYYCRDCGKAGGELAFARREG
jgi:predicted SprT family Zn-dependent metalloprotease